jgi:hypothetical protein
MWRTIASLPLNVNRVHSWWNEMHIKIWLENVMVRVHLEDLDLDERTLFNWSSGRYDLKTYSALN